MAARSVEEFLDGFALPLVKGGATRVGKPISAPELIEMARQLPHAGPSVEAVDEAREIVVSELVPRPPPMLFEDDDLSLVACVHNLLFLSHPRADAWTVTNRTRRKILEASQAMVEVPLARNSRQALARHGLLHNLFELSRIDTKLTWWTGSASFLGQTPPGRLMAWRSVRRVRSETEMADFDELLGTSEVAPMLGSLLRRSPLTRILSPSKEGPPLVWEDAVFLLRDAELARAIAYRAIGKAEPADVAGIPARLAAAYEQMLERQPAEADVRAVTAFLIHLNVLLAWAERRERDTSDRSPLLAALLSPERAGQRPRGLVTFFAVPAAAAAADARLGQLPGMAADPGLAERWRLHRAQALSGVGQPVIDALASRLRRHFRTAEATEQAVPSPE